MSALPPFQRFLDTHAGDVWRLLVASVGRDHADDCFQETFLAAFKAYPRLRPDSDLRAWVLTIAHHKALDHHRARARHATPLAELPETAHHDPEPRSDEELWARVRALPPKQHGAVVLRFAADLAHREVAEALGCSEEAARRSLHEGLKTLRLEISR